MNQDPFEPHLVSLVLSWIVTLPLIIAIFATLFQFFLKKEELPRILTVWFGICLLIFSPARYMVFQMAVGFAYPFQSISAILSTFILAVYVPIVFGILYAIGVGLPMLASVLVFAKDATVKKWKCVLWAVLLPLCLSVGSFFFYKALPLAAWTVHWVDARDVMRATHGPAFYIYKYFAMIGTPHSMPRYFERTPGKTEDFLRCHVASLYLGRREEAYFVKKQYPELYEELTREK